MITASPKINYRDADQAYRDGRDALAAVHAMLAKADAEISQIFTSHAELTQVGAWAQICETTPSLY